MRWSKKITLHYITLHYTSRGVGVFLVEEVWCFLGLSKGFENQREEKIMGEKFCHVGEN